ncbi:putative tRNA pseudouridine synthase 2 [Intoshia linei]|uniref:Putative tRNA pseudouridine synthase 2 n=1 Tax=Intoshia linei TaxID=1819745 RepID=A0A177AWJ8_9BILA|nr:putative tRNA pseudouridine synthase 2 [Intoshia linei]
MVLMVNFSEKISLEGLKIFNSLFSIYKPPFTTVKSVKTSILHNICANQKILPARPIRNILSINSNNVKHSQIIQDYSDHPLVVGPRYIPKEIILENANYLNFKTSGVLVFSFENGLKKLRLLNKTNPISVYRLKCRLGIRMNESSIINRIKGKYQTDHIDQNRIEKVISNIESTSRTWLIRFANIDIQSMECFNLYSTGNISKLKSKTNEALIIHVRCISFDNPFFEIELSNINSEIKHIQEFIQILGKQIRCFVGLDSIRCIRYGEITADMSLPKTHNQWNLENIMINMKEIEEKCAPQ